MSKSRVKRSYNNFCGEESMQQSPQHQPIVAPTDTPGPAALTFLPTQQQLEEHKQQPQQPIQQQQQQQSMFGASTSSSSAASASSSSSFNFSTPFSTPFPNPFSSHTSTGFSAGFSFGSPQPPSAAAASSLSSSSSSFNTTMRSSPPPPSASPVRHYTSASSSSSSAHSHNNHHNSVNNSHEGRASQSSAKRSRRANQADVSMMDDEDAPTDSTAPRDSNLRESPFANTKLKRAHVEDLMFVPRAYKKQAIAAALSGGQNSSASHSRPVAALPVGTIPAPPSSTGAQLSNYHNQLFTYDQVANIVKNALELREEQIRAEYDRILHEQLREQFDNFSSFNRDYVSKVLKNRDKEEDEAHDSIYS